MTVAEVVRKMVEYSKGDLHDINHFMKVYACKNNRRGRKSVTGAAEAGGGYCGCP